MTRRTASTTRIPRAALLTALLALLAVPATAGDCYRAEVPETIGLPDGTTRPSGSITVCRLRTLSPVAALHSLSVDGRDLGMFIGRRVTVESDDDRPAFVFARGDSQALELRAVAYSNNGRYTAWRADRIGRGTRPRVRTSGSFDLAGRLSDDGAGLVLIAAAD